MYKYQSRLSICAYATVLFLSRLRRNPIVIFDRVTCKSLSIPGLISFQNNANKEFLKM